MTLAPSGNPLYVANEDDNLVTVIDINTGKVITDIPVSVEPEGMGMSPDGKVLVNTSETTNMAHFIDTKKRKPSTTFSSTRGHVSRGSIMQKRSCGSAPRSAGR